MCNKITDYITSNHVCGKNTGEQMCPGFAIQLVEGIGSE